MPGETRMRSPGLAALTAAWMVGWSAGTLMVSPDGAPSDDVVGDVLELEAELHAAVKRATAARTASTRRSGRRRVMGTSGAVVEGAVTDRPVTDRAVVEGA